MSTVPYIITNRRTSKSADLLGYKQIECVCMAPATHRKNPVIRWGATDSCDSDVVTVNSNHSIKMNCNKMQSSLMMATEVRTPMIYRKNIPDGLKVVVRPITHESMGEDFELVEWSAGDSIEGGHYATEFIETPYEYRIWKFGDEFLAAKRVKTREQAEGEADEDCRSEWGYSFMRPTDTMKRQTTRAFKAVGLYFGAADVLWHEEDYCYYFLELNSAPSLDHPKVLAFFKANFEKLVR